MILVDQSSELLGVSSRELGNLLGTVPIETLNLDFMKHAAPTGCESLVTLFGITIGNIDIGPLDERPPSKDVIDLLRLLLAHSAGGYVLFTFDKCLDEKENAIRYSSTPLSLLHLNVLDWAVAEGKISKEDRAKVYYHPLTRTWF